MKLAITLARILVGLLFIFSGLIKANDPLGLSYKMQEYFEIWGTEWLNPVTLTSSLLMNAFEIIAGAALLLGWRIRLFSWLLLLLIMFFTFLTGYTYVTGKPTNCGCFGDCIPLTSKTSFLKDIALTALITFLFGQQKNIRPLFSTRSSNLSMIAVILFAFGFQWYTLTYLPVIDCLPFKKQNNITQKMQIPAGAVPDSFAIVFVYQKQGKEYEFTPSELPADLDSYTFVKRRDKLVRKGNMEPPIKGFALSGITEQDSTTIVLSQSYAVLLFCQDFSVPVSEWKAEFEKLYAAAKAKNIPVYAITTQLREAQNNFASTGFKDIVIFKCDFTAIRTAARANPTIYLIKEGTVIDKQSHRRMDKLTRQIKSLPIQQPAPVIQ